jgi:hypothetical protein
LAKRPGSLIAAQTDSATTTPIPGTVMNRVALACRMSWRSRVGDLVAQRRAQREQHPDQLGELRLVRELVAGDLGGSLP